MTYAALNFNTSSEKQQHTNSKLIKKIFTEMPKDTPDFHFGFLHITNFIAVKGPYQRHAGRANL